MRAMAGFNEPALLINYWLGRPSGTSGIRGGHFTRGLVEPFSPDGTELPVNL
jgi:hypothetical protein